MDLGVAQQWAEQAVDKLGMDVADVGVDPADQVALQDEEALPQRFTLALEHAVTREDLAVLHDRDAGALRDRCRAVRRPRIDYDDLVNQRYPVHQRVFESTNDSADGRLLVKGREA